MTHETLFLMLLRTSLILILATILIGVLLRVTRCRSAMIHRLAWFFVIAQGVLWIQYPLAVPAVTVSTKTMPGHIMSMGSLAYIDEDRGEVVILPIKTLQEELPDLYQDGQLHERPPEWFLKQHAHFRELPKSVPPADDNVEAIREEETSEKYILPQDQSNHQSRNSHGAATKYGTLTTLAANGPWLFCVIWAVGMAVIILLRAIGYCRLLMLLRNAQKILPEQNRQWCEVQAALGITADHRLRLLLTDQIGPGLVTRPSGAAVLVPQSLWEDASDFVREGVLRHELSHYRHRDGLKSLLFFLLVAVHWFNPFAWFAWRKFNAAAEWRCDLEAYGRNEDSLYRFAESMLALHKTTDRHVALLHGFKNRDLKERVQRLGEQRTYPKESRMKKVSIITVAVLCLVFGAVKFVPVDTLAQPPDGPPAPPPGGEIMSPTGNINVGAITRNAELAKMLSLTTEQMNALRGIEETFRPTPPAPPTPGQEISRPAPPDPEEARKRADAMWVGVQQSLRPNQRTALGEVTFQLGGGLNSPRMNERLLATLDLTETQKVAIREMVTKREAEARAIREVEREARESGIAVDVTPEQRRIADEEREKKYADQMKTVLTAEQMSKAERLTAGIPALREKLGMPAQPPRPGEHMQGQDQNHDFTPGPNSWQPGQGAPENNPNREARPSRERVPGGRVFPGN